LRFNSLAILFEFFTFAHVFNKILEESQKRIVFDRFGGVVFIHTSTQFMEAK
jgi:hypothetical protein